MDVSGANKVVFVVGRLGPQAVDLLGTAVLLPKAGLFATAAHVTGQDDTNLVIALKPQLDSIDGYQDTTDTQVQYIHAKIVATDPFHDMVILKADVTVTSNVRLGRTDSVTVGETVEVLGYPHADHGRMVLTHQSTDVGAKVLIGVGGMKAKHLVLNIQTRPGQSGSPIFKSSDGELVAILIGSYAPGGGGGISLGGVDPHTLHQTTHAVSAEYLATMLDDV